METDLLKNVKLISNASEAWKFLSMQFPALNLAFILTWAALPKPLQDAVPVPVLLSIAVVLIVLGMLGRLYKQTGLTALPEEKTVSPMDKVIADKVTIVDKAL